MSVAKVSIIIPTYNYGKYIEETIKTCFEQEYKDIEIIIVDDGSVDNTREVLNKYINEGLINYIYQKNKGLPGARNTGLKAATGRYIQFLDSDDLLHKDKIKAQVEILEREPQIDGVYTFTQYFQGTTDNVVTTNEKYHHESVFIEMLNGNFIPVNAFLIRKSNVYFDENMLKLEDWDYWLRFTKGKEIICLPKYLNYVRLHDSSMSTDIKGMTKYKIKVFMKLLQRNDLSIPQKIIILLKILNLRIKLITNNL